MISPLCRPSYIPSIRCVLANLEEISCETYLDVQRKSLVDECKLFPLAIFRSKSPVCPISKRFPTRLRICPAGDWRVGSHSEKMGSKKNKIGMKAKQRADCVIEPRSASLSLKWWQFIYLLHAVPALALTEGKMLTTMVKCWQDAPASRPCLAAAIDGLSNIFWPAGHPYTCLLHFLLPH